MKNGATLARLLSGTGTRGVRGAGRLRLVNGDGARVVAVFSMVGNILIAHCVNMLNRPRNRHDSRLGMIIQPLKNKKLHEEGAS